MKKFIALTFGASTFFLTCYCTVSAQTENNKPLTHTLTQEDMDYAETIGNRIESIISGNSVFALKPEDIIASAKLNGWSEETFEQYMSRYDQERHQLAVDLMAVLTDTNSSSETQCYAAYYLGAMRASEASEILASKIALQFSNGGVVHHFHVYPDGCYPIVDDLVQIGSPATTAIIRNLAESDNSKIEELSLQVIYRIEGDKDIVQLRLQKALAAEKDAKNQARLRSAIKALADNSSADSAPQTISAEVDARLKKIEQDYGVRVDVHGHQIVVGTAGLITVDSKNQIEITIHEAFGNDYTNYTICYFIQ